MKSFQNVVIVLVLGEYMDPRVLEEHVKGKKYITIKEIGSRMKETWGNKNFEDILLENLI